MTRNALMSSTYWKLPTGTAWSLANNCSPSQVTYDASNWAVTFNPLPDILSTACLPLQSFVYAGGNYPFGDPNYDPGAGFQQMVIWDGHRTLPNRWANRLTWTRPATATGPIPNLIPFPTLYPSLRLRPLPPWLQPPELWTPLDPFTPPGRPARIPFAPINRTPFVQPRSPTMTGPEGRRTDPRVRRVPAPPPVIRIAPVRPRPGLQPRPRPVDPVRPPAVVTVITAPRHGPPRATTTLRSHARRPPRGKEKENKIRGKLAYVLKLFSVIVGTATEAADFVNVMYQALPEKRRERGNVPVWKKLQALYDYGEEMDLRTLVRGFVKNQIEDFIYGLQGQANKYRYQQTGSRGMNQFSGERFSPFSKAFNKGLGEYMKSRGIQPRSPTDYTDAVVDYLFDIAETQLAAITPL